MKWPAAVLMITLGCADKAEDKPLQFTTLAVDEGAITARVTASGTLSPVINVQVGSQVSGRIAAVEVDFNSAVQKGQVLARIDSRLFDAALAQARAGLALAKANLTRSQVDAAHAQRTFERTDLQFQRGVLTAMERENALAATETTRAVVLASAANVAQAQAMVHQAEINLAYAIIRAPLDGTVISRAVDVGQTVAASFQSPVLFTIAGNLQSMQLDANVSEADVGKLTAGMPARFTVDAYPGRTFEGTVRQIRNAPLIVQNVVTYDAVIDVPNKDLALRPGMTATVSLVHAERETVLRIPNAALRFRPPPEMIKRAGAPSGGLAVKEAAITLKAADAPVRRTVWILRNGEPSQLSVSVGISDGTMTEVRSAELHAGDTLITDVIVPKGPAGIPGLSPPGGGGGRGRRTL